jgi:hypothetical protein
MGTSLLLERVKRLEHDLRQRPMAHYLHYDLPFAAFCYPPAEEWLMRGEMARLKTRLENDHVCRVVYISLSELLWQAVDESEPEGMQGIVDLEKQSGFEAAEAQISDYLSDPSYRPLPQLLAARLKGLDPERDLAFICRAGALAPNIYLVSKLLDEMKNKTRVPCVLFMPATTEAATIRFMGITAHEGRGSYHVRVYAD